METTRPNNQIWQEHRTRLLGFVRGRVGVQQDAEDIVHDVLLRAWIRRDGLRDEGKVLPWLYQIARNAIVDHYRQRRPEESLSPEHLLNLPSTEEEEEDAVRELAGCLLPFIEHLPPIYREAITLAEINGLTQQQTADRLGISLSGAKSRVQRGRKMLADALLDCCRIEFDCRGGINGRQELACGCGGES